MKTRNAGLPLGAAAVVMAGAVVVLSACDRQQEPVTAGQKLDAAVAQAKDTVANTKEAITQGAAEAQREAKEAMRDAGKTIDDVAITASVNAKLAGDPELSALNIEVDTESGRVALHGSVPTAAARDRATQVASSVGGVQDVDNQLEVKPKG